jgi:hypothetical protein
VVENTWPLFVLRQDCLHDSLQQGNIAIDSDLKKQVGESCAGAQPA